jgi:hypothetical protein
MKKNESQQKVDKLDFPLLIKDITKEDCAKILHKALAFSKEYSSIAQLSKAVGLSRQSIGDYFYARHKPTQKTWTLLISLLSNRKVENIEPGHEKGSGSAEVSIVVSSAQKLKALLFLIEEELNYFKNSSKDDRRILKELIPGPTVGYITSLLSALYDEDQLEIFRTFSEQK